MREQRHGGNDATLRPVWYVLKCISALAGVRVHTLLAFVAFTASITLSVRRLPLWQTLHLRLNIHSMLHSVLIHRVSMHAAPSLSSFICW